MINVYDKLKPINYIALSILICGYPQLSTKISQSQPHY
jgi:hypothetical protein